MKFIFSHTIRLSSIKVVLCLLPFLHGKLSAQKSTDSIHIEALLHQAEQLTATNIDSAYLLVTKSLGLSLTSGFKTGIAKSYMYLGDYYSTKGKNDSAQLLFRLAIQSSKEINNSTTEAKSLEKLSRTYSSKGASDSAFYFLFRALSISEKQNDSITLGAIYNQLGVLSYKYGKAKDAINYLDKALELFTRLRDTLSLSKTYNQYGIMYYDQMEDKKALSYFLKAKTLHQLLKHERFLAHDMNYIGLCYESLDEDKLALGSFREALKYFTKFEMNNYKAEVLFNIGIYFYNRDNADSAIYYLDRAQFVLKNVGKGDIALKTYSLLSLSYALKGDYPKAYDYQVKYATLNDSLITTEKVKQIAEMQTIYETEKKENQIKFLSQEKKTLSAITSAENKRQKTILTSVVFGLILVIVFSVIVFKRWRFTQKQKLVIEAEKHRSEELLLNILPGEVAEELKITGSAKAKSFQMVTVLFTDFKNFTKASEKLSAEDLVAEINYIYSAFDAIVTKHNIEKIKTIGDSYMCAGGLPIPNTTNPLDCIKAALELNSFIEELKIRKRNENKPYFEIRIGLHTGPVVAGIVGTKKFAYDIWGDAVNIASRMESSGESGKINISGTTYELVKHEFKCTYRGKIAAKNKGEIDMYFVN